MDNKYQRGKIYKLVSSQTNKIYIGSTIQTLKQRKSKHKYSIKKNKYSSKFICCYEDFDIILIKEYPCNSKKELLREEGNIIKQNLDICVNHCIAGRTEKEWKEENREKVLIRDRQYYYKNKDKILKYNKINKDKINENNRNRKWYCECCKITISRSGKKRHESREKHQSNSARYNLI